MIKLRRQCHNSQGKGKGHEGKRWSNLSALIVSHPITHVCLICFDNFPFWAVYSFYNWNIHPHLIYHPWM